MSKTKDHERHIVRPNGPHILFSYCLMDLMDGATECLSSWIIFFFFFLAGLVVVTSQDEADSAFLTHTTHARVPRELRSCFGTQKREGNDFAFE